MKCLLSLSVLTALALISSSPAIDPTPSDSKEVSLADLPDWDKFKADAYIAAAASLQAKGKDKAAAILTALAKDANRGDDKKIILLCRMLFQPKPIGEFRRPSIGAPVFVAQVSATDWPTRFFDWPLEPIEMVDGVPFLVVNGYVIGGYPESGSKYLDYCLKNCDWNPKAIKAKTAQEKKDALAKLSVSPKWKQPLTANEKKRLASQIE